MANKFEIVISAADRATAVVRKINRAISAAIPTKRLVNSATAFSKALGLDRVGRGLNNVRKAATDVASRLGSIVAPLAAITGIGSITAMAMLAVEWGRWGLEITRTSVALGVSANQLQLWRGAAGALGIGADQTTESIAALGNTMEDALYGRNQTALALMNKLGIRVHRLRDGTIDTTRSLTDLSSVLSRIHNAQARGLVARTLGVEPLLPLLVQGPKAIAEYQARVRELGGVMGAEATAQADRFGVSVNMLHVALGGLRNTIAARLIPVIQPFVDRLTNWIGANRELIATKLDGFLQGMTNWLQTVDFTKVLNSLLKFIDDVNKLVDSIGGWKNAMIAVAVVVNGSLIASVLNLGTSLIGLTATTIPVVITSLGALATAMGSAHLAGESLLGSVKAIGLLRAAGWLGAAGYAGYEFGKHVVNPAIDWAVSKASGSETTLGGAIFDLTHKPYDPNAAPLPNPARASMPGQVHVEIDHKNAPPGTRTTVSTTGNVSANARVDRAMPAHGAP